MDVESYWSEVNSVYAEYRGAWRYGQTCFNVLHNHIPELAEAIRGTSLDPFNWHDSAVGNSTFWDNFVIYIARSLNG